MLQLPPALKLRDFRLFWTGAVLSAVGSQLTTVAMAWQIYELTNSPLQIGLLGLGRALPQIGLALVGGVLADAMDRRRLMMIVQLGQLAVSAGLALLTLVDAITPAYLFAAAVMLAFGSALEAPPRQAIVPNLVPVDQLSSAIALNTTQRSLGTILGPSLAGVLLAVAGPELCYLIDSASWLAMLSALALIKLQTVSERGVQGLSLAALLGGARFVLHQPVILAFMVLDFGATLFGSPNALFPVFARDLLNTGPVGLGLLYAAPSIGGALAGVVMSMRAQIVNAGRWVLVGVAFYAVCTIAFAFSNVLWLSVLMLAGAGIGNLVSAVLRGTTNQLLTPDQLRGRVAAVNSAFVMGGPQLGQFESGLIADLWSTRMSAATGGLGALVLVLVIGLVPGVWHFRLGQQGQEKPVAG
ncbi:MAG TPA: MFS transporter [Dehalococcoidia bacterium]|nr:MFS transporter [Dehalococcoidia bacterium]